MIFNRTHIHNVAFDRPIPYTIYSFIGVVSTYYDLPIIVSQRIQYIIKCIGTNYHKYFGTHIPYENVVLGVTLFSIDEFNIRCKNNSPPFDIREFIKYMYGKDKVQQNIIEVYRVWYIIDEIFT